MNTSRDKFAFVVSSVHSLVAGRGAVCSQSDQNDVRIACPRTAQLQQTNRRCLHTKVAARSSCRARLAASSNCRPRQLAVLEHTTQTARRPCGTACCVRSRCRYTPKAERKARLAETIYAGGHMNRLLLSIRSGIPQEVDYALELLVQSSYVDAANIPLETLPGLPAALLDIVASSNAKDPETTRRRLEAALTLRNLVLTGGPRCIEQIKGVQELLFETLHKVAAETEPLAELLLYLLDIAEVYASTTGLTSGLHAAGKTVRAPIELYTSLAKLAQSNDRALVIGAYTLIGALAMCEQNEKVFTLSADSSEVMQATLALLQRAVQLIGVNDASLILPVSEFLYQHTAISINAAMMLVRLDLRDTLKLLASRIPEGSREEVWEMEVSGADARRGAKVRDNLRATYPILGVEEQEAQGGFRPAPRLTPEQLHAIIQMPEPTRTIEWCVVLCRTTDCIVADIAYLGCARCTSRTPKGRSCRLRSGKRTRSSLSRITSRCGTRRYRRCSLRPKSSSASGKPFLKVSHM